MFHTIHRCEWCDKEDPTVCIETQVEPLQLSYLCLWCITEEYNKKFIVSKPPKR